MNDELSPEDELRLNVLFNTEIKAVRIDESSMTLWALTPQGEASVPLRPNERTDRYLNAYASNCPAMPSARPAVIPSI